MKIELDTLGPILSPMPSPLDWGFKREDKREKGEPWHQRHGHQPTSLYDK